MNSGYDGTTALKWATSVRTWAPRHLAASPEMEDFCTVVENMAVMLRQGLSAAPDLAVYQKAAQVYYVTMLTVFPKVHLRIYEHALLVHVPKILLREPLITGSSFFLEAFNKVWKKYLLFHTNNGRGKKAAGMEEDQEQALSKSSEAGEHRRKANRHSTMDYQSLRSLWALSDPRLAEMAEGWAPSSVIGDTLIDLYGR
jgi:hypothetical protein